VLRCAEGRQPLPCLFVKLKREKEIDWSMQGRRPKPNRAMGQATPHGQRVHRGFNTASGSHYALLRNTYVDINLRSPVQSWQERRQYYAQVIRDGGFRIQVHPTKILSSGATLLCPRTIDIAAAATPSTPSAGSFATSKLLLGNQAAPGKYCGMDGPIQEYSPSPLKCPSRLRIKWP